VIENSATHSGSAGSIVRIVAAAEAAGRTNGPEPATTAAAEAAVTAATAESAATAAAAEATAAAPAPA
jgi:hypothetical protein